MSGATLRQAACLLSGLLLSSSVTADVQRSVAPQSRITPQPSPLARLAELQSTAGPIERLEFADLTLRVLRDSYARELERSFDDPARSAQRRRKLARWQAATRALLDTLDDALWRLHGGAELQVQIDTRQQIILVIGGRPFAVSGPNPGADRWIEQEIVAGHCNRHDCRALDTGNDDRARRDRVTARGNWELRQGKRPAFVIGELIRCEFVSFERRGDKERACQALSAELNSLHDALRGAADVGHRIDWDTVLAGGPGACRNGAMVIDANGTYLDLQAPLCGRIGAPDWRRLVDWLQRSGTSTDAVLVIRDADRLLGG